MELKDQKCPKCGELMILCYERGNPKPFYCCPMCGYEARKDTKR